MPENPQRFTQQQRIAKNDRSMCVNLNSSHVDGQTLLVSKDQRCYKDNVRTNKDIRDSIGRGQNFLYHKEHKPVVRPASAQKMRASMLSSSWEAYKTDEQRGLDKLTGSTKKSA